MSRPTEQEIADKAREICESQNGVSYTVDTANWAIDQALIGMIPETDAIKLDWSRAPDWAKGANIVFTETGKWSDMYGRDNNWKSDGKIKPTQYFDRPKLQWKPKEGEVVFVEEYCGRIIVARVETVGEFACTVIYHDNEIAFHPNQLKPFDPAKIGMKWSDI